MKKPVYLDANIFIKAGETTDAQGETAWQILQAIASGDLIALTSELTLAEVLAGPLMRGDHELVAAYEGTLRSGAGLHVEAITRFVLRQAASIRAQRREIRLPDAIHIATAVECSCAAFLSNDRRISRFENVKVLDLSSVTLEHLQSLPS